MTDAGAVDREGEAGAEALTSADRLPYQQFEVAVPEGAGPDARVRLTWEGQANAGADVILYALAASGDEWVEIDRVATGDDGDDLTLSGTVAVGDHARDGVVTALVQHTEGYAGRTCRIAAAR